MELTVCVCVRDGAAHVDQCLRELVAETAPFATPLVVIDHASRDQTPDLLARWARDYPQQLRVMRFDGDGLGAARDFAWRQSQTAWVGFVDIDCRVLPGWTRAAYDALQFHAADARCAAFGGTNRVAQDGRLLYRACAILLSTYVGGHDSILNRTVSERRRVNHCPTLNVVYRRRALESIGGFDAAYTRVSEDVDVSRRLRRAGYTLWANPHMTVDHIARPTLWSWLRNVFLYGRGCSFQLKRHPEDLDAKFLAPPAVVLAYVAAGLVDLGASGLPVRLALLACAHLSGVALFLLGEARRQHAGLRVWIAASVVGWLTHLTYGAGFLFELPRSRDRFVQ
jgi:glycosyltransferase involved in cell wall biosynthesis